MSYSSEVKNELARIIPERECCRKAELAAIIALSGSIDQAQGLNIRLSTENAATARKIFKTFKEIYHIQSMVKVENRRHFSKTRVYIISTPVQGQTELSQELGLNVDTASISQQVQWPLLSHSCCRRAYMRGLFLAGGFINRPGADYHLEIMTGRSLMANDIRKLLARMKITARTSERKNNLVIYIKESEKIVDFLRQVGANKALLDFENIRIIKSVRNNVNRQVNCETANLIKTVDASLRQVELIKKLINSGGLEQIPARLRDLALLRIDYPDCTLKELGAMMNPPLSKSGAAYRMRKLEKILEELIQDLE
jgi:DNA-binding protein WhiA